MKMRWISLFLVFALALAGCGTSQSGESQDVLPQEPQQVPSQESSSSPADNPLPLPTQNENPDFSSTPAEKFIDLAKNDLAKILGIRADEISVLDSKEMTWPDAALGCPAPEEVYAQGQVHGYRIWLSAGGVEYIYHTDLNGRVILCSNQNPDDGDSTTIPTPEIGVPIK